MHYPNVTSARAKMPHIVNLTSVACVTQVTQHPKNVTLKQSFAESHNLRKCAPTTAESTANVERKMNALSECRAHAKMPHIINLTLVA
jgi:hypothetical protein